VAIVLNWYAPLRLVEWIMARSGASAILVSLAGLALVVIGFLLMTKKARRAMAGSVLVSGVVLLGACLLSYLAVTFFASLFSAPGADIDERVLSPVYPLLWLVLVAAMGWIWSHGRLVGRLAVGLLLTLLVRNKLVYTYWTLRELSADGLGYSSRSWQSSETIENAIALDPAVIYTNDTAAIYLLADRPSYVVPWELPEYDPAAAGQAEAGLIDALLVQDAAVVLFGSGDLPAGWSPERWRVDARGQDGVILSPVAASVQ